MEMEAMNNDNDCMESVLETQVQYVFELLVLLPLMFIDLFSHSLGVVGEGWTSCSHLELNRL